MNSQYQRIVKIKDVVEKVLKDNPATRDNDRLLILKVWKEQHPNLINLSFREFSKMYLDEVFMDTESIRRSRQKIQETYPELRGKSRDFREKNEIEMRSFINKTIL